MKDFSSGHLISLSIHEHNMKRYLGSTFKIVLNPKNPLIWIPIIYSFNKAM